MLFSVTSATWIVTGLGFGIVLALLVCLVFVLQFFGWTMQRITAPKAPKEEKTVSQPVQTNAPAAPSSEEKAAIAAALFADEADSNIAAVAYAVYLAQCCTKHDQPTAMISLKQHETAWNTKSVGLNNIGF